MSSTRTVQKMYDKLPFGISDVDADKLKKYSGFLVGAPEDGAVQVGPNQYFLPSSYERYALDLYNFEARPDDVWLIGFIRSGTTLHCEMVWQIGNDIDFEEAEKNVLDHRFPHYDACLFSSPDDYKSLIEKGKLNEDLKNIAEKYSKWHLEELNNKIGRRFIKSHLPISLTSPHVFESGAKVIYCARNPKDVIVSTYHSMFFFKAGDPDSINFKNVVEMFKNNFLVYLPFFEHLKEAWAKRNDPNFLFLFYEDTMKDKKKTMKTIAKFLNKELSDKQLETLENYLDIDKFRKNKSVNCDHLVELGECSSNSLFIRKGKPGEWREYFTGELEKEVDAWIEENLKGTDIRFPNA